MEYTNSSAINQFENYKSVIIISKENPSVRIFNERKFNKFQRLMIHFCFGFKVENLDDKVSGIIYRR